MSVGFCHINSTRSQVEKTGLCAIPGSTDILRSVVCGLVAVIVTMCAPVSCAQGILSRQNTTEPTDELQRLPSDRKVTQQLQELARQARTGEIARIRGVLQILRAADPSLMVPDGSKTFRPLHRDLIERIQSFPPDLQAELLNEPSATSRLLQIAYEDGGPAGLVSYLHRHSGSLESLKAHLCLAAIHRDRGHRQASLYWLGPVLHSSVPADLRKIAITLRNELNLGAKVESTVDGEGQSDSETDKPLGPDVPAAEADEQNSDDGSQVATVPVKEADPEVDSIVKLLQSGPIWQQNLHLNSAEQRASQDLVRLLAADGDQQSIAWIAGEPMVDSQAVYVRSSDGLLAYDRSTGDVLWTRPLNPQEERKTEFGRMPFPDPDGQILNDSTRLQNSREILELHRDEVSGRMTSDDLRIYVVCDTGEPDPQAGAFNQRFGMLGRRRDFGSPSLRELIAIEKETGRRLWSVGGAPMELLFRNELSQAWFAGPPTVSGGMLYGMIEHDDAHWLVCLRCETGEVVWKLMLAFPEVNILQDPVRQLTSSCPLVADGMIWASTTDGWLMAVDTLTHSVVWSRSMASKPADSTRIRNVRGGMIQTQQLLPLRDAWRPDVMHLHSDSLLVTGLGDHQLLMINLLTGGVRRRVTPKTATVILAVDDESIVVAGPKEIQRLTLDRFGVVWKATLDPADIVAIGPCARIDDKLLIPLSDGSVQIVGYSDGQLIKNIPAPRSAYSAGGLKNTPDGIVSYGLDHVSVYSQSGKTSPIQPDPLKQARFHFDAGRLGEAETILADFTPASEQTAEFHRLLFRIATIRLLTNPTDRDALLERATRYASTAQDRAIVLFLTLETQPDISSERIVELLASPQTVLTVELPQPELLTEQLLRHVAEHPIADPDAELQASARVTRSMRHVLLQVLHRHLADLTASDANSWIAALQTISDTDLLSIDLDTVAIRDELLRRAEVAIHENRLTESAWHLLVQARQCEMQIQSVDSNPETLQETTNAFQARFRSLVDQFINQLTVAAAQKGMAFRPHSAAVNLLAVVKSEMLPADDQEPPPTPQELLAQEWSTWKDQTYSVVPINPVQGNAISQSNETKLVPRYHEDRFLSAWRWSTFREPSVLAIRSLLQPDDPLCTIDGGMFDALSFGTSGAVMRYGSVVLVQNSMGLTAVSVVDQRVLWSRRIPNQSSRALWQMIAEMQLFNRFSTSLPAWQEVFGRDLRICGGSDRWICVQSPGRIEMIDLLTGQNLWSMQAQPGNQHIFATESCVMMTELSTAAAVENAAHVTCLNRTDGTDRTSAIPQSMMRQTILATGDELVTWVLPLRPEGAVFLNWIHAETGEVRHTLELTDMVNCQFMDARTLVSTTSNGTFEFIDLLTFEKQIVQFENDGDADTTAGKGITPDELRKAVILADPANYYVFPFPNRQLGQVQIMFGAMGDLHLYPITKELRAIDRATGKIRWVWNVEENTSAWFDATADPVLLLINLAVRRNKANAAAGLVIPGIAMPNQNQTSVTALSRMSGTKLFEHNIASRFPVSSLEFHVTREKHLDLKAFGSRVRFIPSTPE